MGDDPVPRDTEGHKYNRNFITSSLLKATNVAMVHAENVSEKYLDNNPKRNYTSGIVDIPFSKSQKEYVFFSENLIHIEKYATNQQKPQSSKFAPLMRLAKQYCCVRTLFRFNFKNYSAIPSLRAQQDFICG